MSHTPGPWKVVFPGSTEGRGWHPQAGAWVETSKGTPPIRQNVDHPGHEDAERLANARLIASAPALLEACRYTLEWFEKPTAPNGTLEDRLNSLRAAISLAEGKH
jgi:hypothetical protein